MNRRQRRALEHAARRLTKAKQPGAPSQRSEPLKTPLDNRTHESQIGKIQKKSRTRWAIVVSALASVIIIGLSLSFSSYLEPNAWKLVARIQGMRSVFWTATIAAVTTSPDNQMSNLLTSAKMILETALSRRIALNEALVVEAGLRSIDVARTRPELNVIAWQTASAAISYGSAHNANFKVPIDLPDCAATKPQLVLAKGINDTETTLLLKPIFYSCRLNLDLAMGSKPTVFENGIDCIGCVVAYSGKDLAIMAPKFGFQNSVFVFSMSSGPPFSGQNIATTLLRSKFSEAEE